MSIINGTKLVAPVSVEDARRVLGEATMDIGTLCTSDKINPWAKFKPVAYPGLFPNSLYWQGADKKNGFHLDTNTANTYTNDFVRNFYNNSANWTYVHPAGGMSEPLRLPDFNGYNHSCVPIISSRRKKSLGLVRIPLRPGIVSYTVYVETPSEYDNDGIPIDLSNNLTIADFNLGVDNDSLYCLKDGYLAAILAFQTNNPIEYGFAGVGYDVKTAIRINDKKLSEHDGNRLVIQDFRTGFPNGQSITAPLWIILGIVWGYNKRLWTGIPWDDDNFYAHNIQFYQQTSSWPLGELLAWAKNPVLSGWRAIKWISTEDTVAVPYGINTYWQVKILFDNTADIDRDLSGIQFKEVSSGMTITPTLINEDFSVASSSDYIIPANGSKTLRFNISDLFGIPTKGSKKTIQAWWQGHQLWSLEFQGADNY